MAARVGVAGRTHHLPSKGSTRTQDTSSPAGTIESFAFSYSDVNSVMARLRNEPRESETPHPLSYPRPNYTTPHEQNCTALKRACAFPILVSTPLLISLCNISATRFCSWANSHTTGENHRLTHKRHGSKLRLLRKASQAGQDAGESIPIKIPSLPPQPSVHSLRTCLFSARRSAKTQRLRCTVLSCGAPPREFSTNLAKSHWVCACSWTATGPRSLSSQNGSHSTQAVA